MNTRASLFLRNPAVTLTITVALALSTPLLADNVKFRKVTLNADSKSEAAAAFDVDHDGDIDIVGGSVWYEAPSWTRHKIRDVEIFDDGNPDGYAAQPYDVNHDGWMDFIEVNYRTKSLKWIENPGASLGEWTAHSIAKPDSMESGRLVDFDGDGQLDLLPNAVNAPAWWQMIPKTLPNGSTTTEFIQHSLPQELASHGIAFGDINGDGRKDVVSGDGWAEAPVDPRINGTWKWHPDFELGRVSVPFLVRDVDEDGDADLVYSIGHDFGIYWLEQSQSAGKRVWTKHEIDMTWSVSHYQLWEDLDNNGRPELVAGKRYRAHGDRDPGADDPQGIYRYEFDAMTKTWGKHVISDDPMVGWGLDGKAVDIDQDGDLDLICPGRSGLYLLENLRND